MARLGTKVGEDLKEIYIYIIQGMHNLYIYFFKSRIRETKHLSTDADSSTNAIGGWTKNTKNLIFLKNGKNHPKRKN